MTDTLPLSSKIRRNPDIVFTDMDGETVMMSIAQGKYFGLGGIGPFLWEQLEEPRTVDELCRLVVELYEVDEASATRDVQGFVSGLLDQGIVLAAPAESEA